MATRHVWTRYNKLTDDKIFVSGTGGQGANSLSNIAGASITGCSVYDISVKNGVTTVTPSGTKKTVSTGTSTTFSTSTYPYVVTQYYLIKAMSGTTWKTDNTDLGGFTLSITGGMLYYADITRIDPTKAASTLVYASNSTAHPNKETKDGYYYVYNGSDSIDPEAINYPSSITAGDSVTVTVTPNSSLKYGRPTYVYEYSANGGSTWSVAQTTVNTSINFSVPSVTQIRFRVKAEFESYTSAYVTGPNVTVTASGGTEIHGPTNFSCSKTTARPGDSLTFTWTAATGDFNRYRFYGTGENGVTPSVYPAASATRVTATFPDVSAGSAVTYTLVAQKSSGSGDSFSHQGTPVTCRVTCAEEQLPDPQPPDAPPFITVGSVTQGETVSVSWGSVSGSPVYTLQRSVNGGAFQTVYTGSSLTYTDTLGDTWNTVQYRVKATVDGKDSEWTTSDVKEVNSAAATGGRLEQFQNSSAENIYPKTIVEGVFRQSDGKTLEELLEESGGSGGVESFNGRTGAVTSQTGDYTAAQVGAVPTSRKVNGQALTGDITLITCGTADLIDGASRLAAGTLYGVYEV